MASIIGFSVPIDSEQDASKTGERVQVEESAEDVARALFEADTGFAPFRLMSRPDRRVWVSRAHVMFVREG
jgi:hypothetical protein